MNEEFIIDIVAAFDENFLVPFYVLLTSIFCNNPNTLFRFHVIATGISPSDKDAIKRYVEQQTATISFYAITPSLLQGLVIPKNRHYTVATYYRLFFPQLVPKNIERLLYLDADTVVNGQLRDLYTRDMGTFAAGAVPEIKATKKRPDLGIHEKGLYFNAGVLLMNLREWENQKITEKALQFVYDFPEKIRFADQDALNVVLMNNYLPLEAKYNVLYQDVPKKRKHSEYKSFVRDKVIIHYSLHHKPWNAFGLNRLRFLYFTYLHRSPKANMKKYTNFDPTAKNLFQFTKIRTREIIYNFPALVFILETLNVL